MNRARLNGSREHRTATCLPQAASSYGPTARQRGRRLLVGPLIAILALAGCSNLDDGRIRLTVATFGEFGYQPLYREYEATHPHLRIVERVTGTEDHHKNLAAHLATNVGAADVEAVEEGWMGSFTAAPNRFVDLARYGAGELASRWPDWKWKAGASAGGQVIGLGTDVGGMAMCYRRDLFAQAGLPTERDEVARLWPTWERYIQTGLAFKSRMPGVAFADGVTALYRSALGQSPIGIYDGPDRIVVATNPAVRRAWSLAVEATELGLTAKAAAFGPDWTAGLARGSFATLACPSWMMALIQEQARASAGQWDVATVPGSAGNWGGSWLTVPKQSRHPAEAAALAAWLTAPEQQAKVFRASGNFPSTVSLYDAPVIRDFRSPFFHDAPVGQIFSRSVTTLVPQYMGPRSGDINTRIINGLARIEQGRDTSDESWRKVLDEVEALG
jgi:cellobiose transport system substrate-binding protein